MRLTLKRKIGKIWPSQSYGRKIILLYHSVGNSLWGMDKQQFSDQISWITDHCRVLSLTELIQSEPNKEIQVSVTFDDGYASLYHQVAPILAEKKIGAMVYINTGWIGEDKNSRKQSVAKLGHYPDESFLIWPEVKELYHAGWEIGSHGVNHYNFAKLDSESIHKELSLSKQHIEEYLQTPCLHLAYPWGRYSHQVIQASNAIGYQYAAAAYHAPLNARSHFLALPRMNISTEYSIEDFKNIILGKWDYLGFIHRIRGL